MSALSFESGGYPDEVFTEPVSDTLKCGICLMVLKDPFRVCSSDHNYCRRCIFDAFISGNHKKCPECRKNPRIAVSRVLNGIIQELPVRCYSTCKQTESISSVSATEVCDWVGKLYQLDTHLSLCDLAVIKCSSIDCGIQIQRRFLANHESSCPHKVSDSVIDKKETTESFSINRSNRFSARRERLVCNS